MRERGIPIMVMEPVHGGMLANLPKECLPYLPGAELSPAAWALRFVMRLPGVAVVLSGMSDMRQTEENLRTADLDPGLSEEELAGLAKISRLLRQKIAVPCTGCRYCCDNRRRMPRGACASCFGCTAYCTALSAANRMAASETAPCPSKRR